MNQDLKKQLIEESNSIIEACRLLPESNKTIDYFQRKKDLKTELLNARKNKVFKDEIQACENNITVFELENEIEILENTIHNNQIRKTEIEDRVEKYSKEAQDNFESLLKKCFMISDSIKDLPSLSIFMPLKESESWKEFENHELVSLFMFMLQYELKHSSIFDKNLKVVK